MRGRTSHVNKPRKSRNQGQNRNANAIASGSKSPVPEAAPVEWVDQSALLHSWNNPYDNTWEWEAAGDGSIASDDPKREDKIRWRIEHDHIHSAEYRVKKWQSALGNQPLATVEEIDSYIERPAEVYSGLPGRERSRSRSRSRGRHGRRDRLQAVAEWKAKAPLLARPSSSLDQASSGRTISDDLQAWIEDLVSKRNYEHVQRERALAFFELPMNEKVHKVECLSREIVSGPMI